MSVPESTRFTSTLLHHAADPFRLLVESVKDYAIYMLDQEGRIASWNSGAEWIKGYSAAEVLGRPFTMMFTAEDIAAGKPQRDLEAAFADGRYEDERPQPRKDGSTFWAIYTVTSLREADRHIGFAVVVRDITERRNAEQQVAASHRRFRALVEHSWDGVALLDRQSVVVYVSPVAEQFVGYSASELVGRVWYDLIQPEGRADWVHAFEQALQTPGTPLASRHQIRHRDGTGRWIEQTVTDWLNDPSLNAVVLNFRDLTEIKEAEQLRLKADEATSTLLAIIEGTEDAIIGEDQNGNIIGWNPGAERLYGYPANEVLEQNSALLVPPELLEESRGLKARVWQGERLSPFETVRRKKNGSLFEVSMSLSPVRDRDGRVIAISTIAHDISERKQTERSLEASERRFRELIESIPAMMWVYSGDGQPIMHNRQWYEYTGQTPADTAADQWHTALHPDDTAGAVAAWEHSKATGELYGFEYRLRGKDGMYRWFLSVGTPVRYGGRIEQWIGLCTDIDERKRADAGLRLRDRAMQAVASGIVITDPNQSDNPIIFANPAFELITGYTAAEATGKNCRYLQGRDTDRSVVAQVRAAVAAGQPCDVELLNYRKDGTPFWNHLSISPVHDHLGRLTHFIGVQTDVTERKKLETQFRQAQKMEAIGRLAGGVAHDFNNLLTVINGYSEMLVHQLPVDNPMREMLLEVSKAGERAGSLTKQLLVFSRQSVLEPKLLDINTVVADTEKMLRRLIGEDIRLTTVLAPGLPPVKADPGQLQQAIINLAVNARDAMPQGGKLTVETQDLELTPEQCLNIPECKPGRYSLLAVIDTGIGMNETIKARIFEPFFTTKEPGKGTGLGLAMVYGFVKSSGGHLSVHSEPGRGTTFKIYLPQVQERVSSGKSWVGVGKLPGGTETILLVEDDDAVRALTRHVLQSGGYAVLAASNGKDGVRLAEDHQGPIHLLVTDVVMPYMGGRQVAERVQELKPGIKVLYCSGYTDDAVVRHGVLEAGTAFVQKPYSPALLAQKVRDVLDGRE